MMNKEIKISEREKLCLQALALICSESEYGDDACAYFRSIAKHSGLEKSKARIATRSLVRKGLAIYVRGLFDDDGFVSGSGHCLTPEGRELVEKLQL